VCFGTRAYFWWLIVLAEIAVGTGGSPVPTSANCDTNFFVVLNLFVPSRGGVSRPAPTKSSLAMASIGFRDATSGDREWLYQLKRVTMRDYVAATFGWDESFQQHLFEEDFDPSGAKIVEIDREDAGMLLVEEKSEHFFLRRIELLPKFQRRGIGTRLVSAVIEEAAGKNKPVFLQVLRVNPARILYERLGFTTYEETKSHYKMKHSG
jgi:ribosomal protein S18 acetylase RimI-like enzyme